MSAGKFAAMIGAAALLGGAATSAHAADASKPVDFTVRPDASEAMPNAVKNYSWAAAHGRFGLMLNMQQPDTRQSTWNDVQAGAFYRITPSLRVGGAVALGAQQAAPMNNKPAMDAGQPRVRFETQFKF